VPKNESWGPKGPVDHCLVAAGKGSQPLSQMAKQCIKKLRYSYTIRTKSTVLLLKTYNENMTNVSEQTGEHENRAGFTT
jgi:hypothetical protein